MNSLSKKFHRYRSTFATLASLREIFRISVAALPTAPAQGERSRLKPFVVRLSNHERQTLCSCYSSLVRVGAHSKDWNSANEWVVTSMRSYWRGGSGSPAASVLNSSMILRSLGTPAIALSMASGVKGEASSPVSFLNSL